MMHLFFRQQTIVHMEHPTAVFASKAHPMTTLVLVDPKMPSDLFQLHRKDLDVHLLAPQTLPKAGIDDLR